MSIRCVDSRCPQVTQFIRPVGRPPRPMTVSMAFCTNRGIRDIGCPVGSCRGQGQCDVGTLSSVDSDVGEASVRSGYDGAVADYGVKTHVEFLWVGSGWPGEKFTTGGPPTLPLFFISVDSKGD